MLTLLFILIAGPAGINLWRYFALSVSRPVLDWVYKRQSKKIWNCISVLVRPGRGLDLGFMAKIWWIEIFRSWMLCENRFCPWMGWGGRFFSPKYLLVAKTYLSSSSFLQWICSSGNKLKTSCLGRLYRAAVTTALTLLMYDDKLWWYKWNMLYLMPYAWHWCCTWQAVMVLVW